MRPKDDECFGDGTDEDLDTDFDFEGNLALFDKAAVFSQIDGTNSHSNRAQHHSTQGEQKPVSYRHDENILEGKAIVYRQITVPQHGGKEYCTGENKMHVCILIHTDTTHTCIGARVSFVYLMASYVTLDSATGAQLIRSVYLNKKYLLGRNVFIIVAVSESKVTSLEDKSGDILYFRIVSKCH